MNNHNNTYNIKFQIKYETAPGQDIYILGSIPELGNWKELKCKLKWTSGHIWEKTLNINEDIKSFYYKFVCYDSKTLSKRWEQGNNRYFNKLFVKDVNNIVLFCKWELFELTYSIYYPLDKEHEHMQIIGNHPTIGDWFKNNGMPLEMKLSDQKTLNSKI